MAHLINRAQLARVTRFERRRAKLPEDLSKNVLLLSCSSSAKGGVCDVYVLGTCHGSEQSRREAQAIVRILKPEAVYLELCRSRMEILTRKTLEVPTERDIIAALKNKHYIFGVLYGRKYAEIANKIGVNLDSEFQVACAEAKKYGGSVILGDRPVQITLKRTWSKMPLLHKAKLLSYCLFPPFQLLSTNFKFDELIKIAEMMNDTDLLNHCIQIVGKEFPTVIETMVDERDQFMSSMLLKYASQRRSVVAVVGKGHLEGIKKYWKKPVAEDLMTVPSSKPGPAIRLWKMLTDTPALSWLRMTRDERKN